MRDVGGMEFHEIAPAIANWPLSDLFGLLEAMLLCLKTEGNKMFVLIFANSSFLMTVK